jgi:hypothetical protein
MSKDAGQSSDPSEHPPLYPLIWHGAFAPSVFGRNLKCEPVRKVDNREECHWSHVCLLHVRFKRTYVGSNGILEYKILSKNAHRTIYSFFAFPRKLSKGTVTIGHSFASTSGCLLGAAGTRRTADHPVSCGRHVTGRSSTIGD